MLTASLLLTVLAVALMMILLYIHHSRTKLREVGARLPGPKSVPILGDVLEFGSSTSEIFRNLLRLRKEHGKLFRLWLGPKLFVVMSDPKDIEVILSSPKHINKSVIYLFLESWLGTGLLTSKAEKWHTHRKILTPAFHFKILDQFVDVFNVNGNILIESLREKVNGPAFDITNYITLYALDIICESAMGVSVNAQKNSDSEYVTSLKSLAEIVVTRIVKPWFFSQFLFNLSSSGRQEKKDLKVLHSMTKKVIQERKEQLYHSTDNNTANIMEEDTFGQKKRLAFLDLLLHYAKAGANLTDEDIREEVDTFMFEGHDTTTSGIFFTLWLLAQYPDVQDKVAQEVQEILGSADTAPTLKNLQEMNYMECVIKESLRLYPSVPVIGRELTIDTPMKTEDIIIPKHTSLLICPYIIHRDPEYFSDPEKFDPDRFLPDNVQGRHPYAYVPFSAGPRNCIGQKFAMLEIKSTLAKILMNYQLLPGSENKTLDLTIELILKSVDGINLKIIPRKMS